MGSSSSSSMACDVGPSAPKGQRQRPSACSLAGGACCGCGCCAFLGVFFLVLGGLVTFHGAGDGFSPGDGVRRRLQPLVVEALRSGEWGAVEEAFSDRNAAIIIGDARGTRWEKENGWMTADGEYAIASQSKIITALTIYRLMARSGGLLRPDSRVADFVESWPRDPALPASRATLAHLLAFTTGFSKPLIERVSCARAPGDKQPSWSSCVDEIAKSPIRNKPGETFVYGPWHMVVAAAVAHRALGRELTRDAWIASVREELLVPAGVTAPVRYDGVVSDFPAFFPGFGSWYAGDLSFGIPDFAGGMRMSGREWQKILHAVQFGGLLDEGTLDTFTQNHTGFIAVADRWGVGRGTWRYAQGCWRTCDAAAEAEAAKGARLGKEELERLCGSSPEPRVVHSVGAWGHYAWMDLTNGYYGVFIHSSAVDMVRMFWISILVSLPLSLLACCCCGRCLEKRRRSKAREEAPVSSLP